MGRKEWPSPQAIQSDWHRMEPMALSYVKDPRMRFAALVLGRPLRPAQKSLPSIGVDC